MSRPQQRQGETAVATFAIDSENNIAAHAAVPTNLESTQSFHSEKDLAKLAAEWPGSRLAEVWNSFAGVAPFSELKPVKKFTDRKSAVARIWAAIQRLYSDGAQPRRGVAPETARLKKSAAQPVKRARAEHFTRRAAERSNKKAEVIELMKRPKGATLGEIVEATSWQKHTVRGFVSILGSKGGVKVESSKNADGERTYRVRK
jgi:hypothetical protein